MSIVFLSIVTVAGAQVDQQNWDLTPPPAGFGAVQQGFTPTFDTLDSVQLVLSTAGAVGFPGGDMYLRLRVDGPSGPVIATSDPTYVSPWYDGPVGFGFADPVSLVPGRTYVLEPFNHVAAANFSITPPRYAGGQFYGNFEPANYDLVFREGIGLETVPEPTAIVLLGVGAVCSVFKCRTKALPKRVLGDAHQQDGQQDVEDGSKNRI